MVFRQLKLAKIHFEENFSHVGNNFGMDLDRIIDIVQIQMRRKKRDYYRFLLFTILKESSPKKP